MRAREIERILSQDSWYVKNQKGSHRMYIHPVKPGKITVPYTAAILTGKLLIPSLNRRG